MYAFQFLIGRLLTVLVMPNISFRGGFQFLIGRLLTPQNALFGQLSVWFQFLIGRLLTWDGYDPLCSVLCGVSIPYR